MTQFLVALCLVAQPPDQGAEKSAPQAAERKEETIEYLRSAYRADADKYEFFHDSDRQQPLQMADKPIMRWANDDDWSGDVFVWTHAGRPEVIGCILSGPGRGTNRMVFHEFHLAAEKPIAAVDLQTHRRWQPKEGVPRQPVPEAPLPAKSASARLAQMRQLSREFTGHMEADGAWELRLLPQPLFRYGKEQETVVDGALFAYVWTKGTDPEVILMLECRKSAGGLAWHFAPLRFSNRAVWLRHHDQEAWRVEGHHEPAGKETTLVYSTAFARDMPRQPPEDVSKGNTPRDDAAGERPKRK